MSDKGPVSAQPLAIDDARLPTPWAEAQSRLERAQFYWLATARPDGLPHVVPVLAVWLDGSLHFVSGPTTRKGKNLARDPRCVIAADADDLHLIVEGEAAKVSDEARLRRVADVYASKYGWEVRVRGGAFYADGAPTAGPPPYEVHEVNPATIFSLGTDESFRATRWRF